ncbi:hypothetical protein [uncultured Microbacterium sp.]|uniref:hypothetical protein n=1 Tax=uncultured Microbacterium sp. TaxID=191216 RepID=UPI002622E9B4|nr:hypothetical protein [uncultured Microbacterium sp.]
MNHTESRAIQHRSRAAVAALIAVLMALFTTITAPTAMAAESASIATSVSASESGLEITVNATGLPEVAGLYGAFIEQGNDAALNEQSYVAFALPFPSVKDGAASFVLNAPAEKLDRERSYEVVLWKQHSAFTPENLYGRANVEITAAQWDAVFPPRLSRSRLLSRLRRSTRSPRTRSPRTRNLQTRRPRSSRSRRFLR